MKHRKRKVSPEWEAGLLEDDPLFEIEPELEESRALHPRKIRKDSVQPVEDSAQTRALRAVNVELYRKRYEEGRDIFTGKKLKKSDRLLTGSDESDTIGNGDET